MNNPYRTLRVPADASDDLIDHAFREAAYSCHPDRYPSDSAKEERYKHLVHSRDQLKDPETRKRIDRALRTIQAAERQKKREAKCDQTLIQSAMERQGERAVTRREPPSTAVQRQGAIRAPPPTPRPGPPSTSTSARQRTHLSPSPPPAHPHPHSTSASSSRHASQSVRPDHRPPPGPLSLITRSNAKRQAPKRPPLLHAIPAALYEEQARLRITVQQSWMPGGDRGA